MPETPPTLPAHLKEAIDQARDDSTLWVKETVDEAKTPARNPMSEREYTFSIDWTAPNGHRFAGLFTHRVPSIGQTIAIERATQLASRTAEGTSMQPQAQLMVSYVCAIEPTLTKRPEWAEDLFSLPHPKLLELVAEEVARHMRCFHGVAEPQRASA